MAGRIIGVAAWGRQTIGGWRGRPRGADIARGGAAVLPIHSHRNDVTEVSLLRSLGLMIVAAALLLWSTRRLRIPSIVTYIVAGLLLGPVAGLLAISHIVEIIAEVGIALLLFLVGLELSLDKIRDVGRVAVLAGLGQVVFTAAGGFALALALGFSAMESIFLATALTFSSTVVVVKLLDQKGELNDLYGRIAVGIFLVQDLVVIVVLTFLSGLGNPEELAVGPVLQGVGSAFGGMGLLLATALLSARFVLPRVFGWVASSSEAIFIWSLTWCFALVYVAEVLQLSLEIGAFLAGLSLAQLPYNEELRRRVHPLMSFFIAIFFVTLGVRMELGAAATHMGSALALSLFVLIGNPFIFLWIIARLGYSERTSFMTSVTVAQISEFSFIFAALGLSTGLIDESILSLVAVVGLVTIGVSSYMIIYSEPLYARVRRWGLLRMFGAGQTPETEERVELSDHVIVVGMNALGRMLVNALIERGETVLAIDTDPAKLKGLPCPTLHGNVEYESLLEAAHLHHAKLLVSALQIEDTNNLLAFRSREAGVPASIHAFDRSVVPLLEEIGVSHLMVSKNVGLKRIAIELRTAGMLD
jgi:Kef-type K+ transport system membrane component KefB